MPRDVLFRTSSLGLTSVLAAAAQVPFLPLSMNPQGLAFRRGTHQLYSTSHDRSVKVWNVAENSYVETL